MAYDTLKTAISNYLAVITNHLTGITGNRGDVLFVDNHAGDFSFTTGPMVVEFGIVVDQADLDHSQQLAEQTGTSTQLFDLRDDTLYSWDGVSWTSAVTERSQVLVGQRLYLSPYTQKAFFYDNTGLVEQLRGSA